MSYIGVWRWYHRCLQRNMIVFFCSKKFCRVFFFFLMKGPFAQSGAPWIRTQSVPHPNWFCHGPWNSLGKCMEAGRSVDCFPVPYGIVAYMQRSERRHRGGDQLSRSGTYPFEFPCADPDFCHTVETQHLLQLWCVIYHKIHCCKADSSTTCDSDFRCCSGLGLGLGLGRVRQGARCSLRQWPVAASLAALPADSCVLKK